MATVSTIPTMAASAGTDLNPSACRAELPWANMTNSPSPAPTVSTATMVFTPGLNRLVFSGFDEHGPHHEQLATLHAVILLGGHNRSYDFSEIHGVYLDEGFVAGIDGSTVSVSS